MKFIFIAVLTASVVFTAPKPTAIDEPSPPVVHAQPAQDVVEEKPVKNIEKEPVVDPQGCEPEMHWAAEPPHDCIPKKAPRKTVSTHTGNWVEQCHVWAAEVGIHLNSWAIELLDRESNCDPTVWNYAGSGACGIPQSLPCSKMPQGINTPPPQQIKWMHDYVMARYGSWQAAVAFHDRMNWY